MIDQSFIRQQGERNRERLHEAHRPMPADDVRARVLAELAAFVREIPPAAPRKPPSPRAPRKART